VTLGLDGNLYAFCSSNVFEFNPITMNLINTIDLPYTNYYGLAVNASGDIYATEYNSNVDEFSPQVTLRRGLSACRNRVCLAPAPPIFPVCRTR
jgi:hypothetical protein